MDKKTDKQANKQTHAGRGQRTDHDEGGRQSPRARRGRVRITRIYDRLARSVNVGLVAPPSGRRRRRRQSFGSDRVCARDAASRSRATGGRRKRKKEECMYVRLSLCV
jgi:hypothetical protein